MDWMITALWACLVVVMYIASVMLHEAGHGLVGRWCRHTITSFGVGRGRPLLSFSWLGMRVYLCLNILTGGLTFALQERLGETRWRRAMYIAAGPLSNLLAALCTLPFLLAYPDTWQLYAFSGINLYFFLTSAIPFKIRQGDVVLYSDGAHIYRILRGTDAAQILPQTIETFAFLGDHFARIKDDLGVEIERLCRAVYWLQLGHVARAEALLLSLDPDVLSRAPYAVWLQEHAHLSLAQVKGDTDASQDRLETLETMAQKSGDLADIKLVEIAHIERLIAHGAFKEARSWAHSLTEEDLPPRLLHIAHNIASRLSPDAASNEASDLDPAYFLLHYDLGKDLEARGDTDAAVGEFSAFVRQMNDVLLQFQLPENQLAFIEVHREKLRPLRPLFHDAKAWDDVHLTQALLEWEALPHGKSRSRQSARPSRRKKLFRVLLITAGVLAGIYLGLTQFAPTRPAHRPAQRRVEVRQGPPPQLPKVPHKRK